MGYYRSFVILGACNTIYEHSINNEEHVMTPPGHIDDPKSYKATLFF